MTADGYRHSCLGVVGAIAILAVPVLARTSDGQIQPRSREAVVTGAPYVADSIVTVNLTGLGGPAEAPVVQRVVARVYRDSAGRVRREQVPGAQDAPKPADSADLIVIILDPVASVVYSLNPATRTAYRMPLGERERTMTAPAIPQSVFVLTESLGTKQIEGITVSGRQGVITLPAGQDGRPVEISEERWESSDLEVAIIERHRDSRTGVFEHRLLNIRRIEPAPELFVVPPSYSIVDVPAAPSR
jgi:hypothetical protein